MVFTAKINTAPTRVLMRGHSRVTNIGLSGEVGHSATGGQSHTLSDLHPVSLDCRFTNLIREMEDRITSKVTIFKAGIE